MAAKKRFALKGEILGGITTFLTVSYIVVVNPSILSTEGTGIPFSGALTATVLLCFSMTLLMGLYANLPFAVAPGMGINAFLTYGIILGQKIPWQIAFGMVFWAGVIFLILSVLPIRLRIAQSIPFELKTASAVGIGLFLTFIGLKNASLITPDPVTLVRWGALNHETFLSLGGLLIIIFFLRKKNPFAFLIGIVSVTLISWAMGMVDFPTRAFSRPDFSSVFLKLNIFESLKWVLLPAIFALALTDLFDSISTFIGVSTASNILDEKGEPKNLKEGLIVDAWATLTAGLLGTSSGTAYIESAAGIEAGARTGVSSMITAVCFLPFFFFGTPPFNDS